MVWLNKLPAIKKNTSKTTSGTDEATSPKMFVTTSADATVATA
jgi:hypothetical protein